MKDKFFSLPGEILGLIGPQGLVFWNLPLPLWIKSPDENIFD